MWYYVGIGFDISIHALRKESDPLVIHERIDVEVISIHALRKESDRAKMQLVVGIISISIHALRKESDPSHGMHNTAT